MRTPAGRECKHFYGDYYRGREREECRLLKAHDIPWTPDLCASCPVPDILRANACTFMELRPVLQRSLLPPWRREVRVTAFCRKTSRPVSEPEVGCGQCHTLPEAFLHIADDNS